jgi:hypothetical protein
LVPAGATSASFTFNTGEFYPGTNASITAQYGGVSKTVAVITSAPSPPQLTITNRNTISSLGKDSSGNTNYCATPVVKSAFMTTDSSVDVWFTFDNGHVGDVLLINWIHPSGAIDASQPTTTLNYNGSGCYMWMIGIAGQQPANEPGNWQVRLLVNGAVAFTLPFTITLGPPVVTAFTVSPNNITCCTGPETLSWITVGATSASIGGIGAVPVNGSKAVWPSEGPGLGYYLTYTITVSGPGGTSQRSVNLRVMTCCEVI